MTLSPCIGGLPRTKVPALSRNGSQGGSVVNRPFTRKRIVDILIDQSINNVGAHDFQGFGGHAPGGSDDRS
jgi:hypothetical protein